MFEGLIDYWKTIDLGKENDLIHESDKDLEKDNNQRLEKYKLHFELFPEPFNGNLRNPKIVFLFLNPGYNEADKDVKKDISKDVIKAFKQGYTDKDEYPFLWLNPKYDKCNHGLTRKTVDVNDKCNPGAYYWNKLFDQKTGYSFMKNLYGHYADLCSGKEIKPIVKNYDEARKWIAQNVCDIELFPYHSEKFHYSFADCKSADVARCNVFKEIEEHPEVLFVLMRSRKLWTCELKEREELLDKRDYNINKKGNAIINPCPRNPSLNPGKELGKAIYCWLKNWI